MNIQIITSSFPAYPHDASGTAGLFVRSFASQLRAQGHTVIVQPVARKSRYDESDGLIIKPLPWGGGDVELASLNLWSLKNILLIIDFFKKSKSVVIETHKQYQIDRTLCMWALPSGLFGYWIKKTLNRPYDVWALGSDIWKIRKIPFFGKFILKKIIGNADRVFADGKSLCQAVEQLTKRTCEFLPSSRILPNPRDPDIEIAAPDHSFLHLLFVGRYHTNKGPDVLLNAFLKLEPFYQKKIHIRMYGLGPLTASLKKFVLDHHISDSIELNDGIDAQELVSKLRQSDYLIIPSRIESIPVIFSDALQTGTPVIATPLEDLKEVIQKYDCGILADDFTPAALALAIQRACDERREPLVQGAQKAFQKFNLQHTATTWLTFSAPDPHSEWEKRSLYFKDSLQGVLFKNLPPVVNEHIHHWHMHAIRTAIPRQPGNLLDIGCGYGRISTELIKEFPSLNTVGLDISPEYVKLYKARTGQAAYTASLEDMPDTIGTFDCILIVTVLMYLSENDLPRTLQRAWSHLAPGGRLIIIEPHCSGAFFQNPFGIKNLFSKQGNHIQTKGRRFKTKEMTTLLRSISATSPKRIGMPMTTIFIIPIYAFAKIFPKRLTRGLLKGVLWLDKILGRFPLPTLHTAYTITKE